MTERDRTEGSLPHLDLDRLVHEPARLQILSQLYVVSRADFLFVLQRTGLTRGNLSSHMSKLEAEGYLEIDKQFVDKKPRTLLRLSPRGRKAFERYVGDMKRFLEGLPSNPDTATDHQTEE